MKRVYAAVIKVNKKQEILAFYTEDAKRVITWKMEDKLNRGVHILKMSSNVKITETTITLDEQ